MYQFSYADPGFASSASDDFSSRVFARKELSVMTVLSTPWVRVTDSFATVTFAADVHSPANVTFLQTRAALRGLQPNRKDSYTDDRSCDERRVGSLPVMLSQANRKNCNCDC